MAHFTILDISRAAAFLLSPVGGTVMEISRYSSIDHYRKRSRPSLASVESSHRR